MLILHIADIHFRHPECNTNMDADRPFRTALVNDVRDQVGRLGCIDAILVGGDIAYRGHAEEYSVALEWLRQLTSAAGCTMEDVFVVPGNHDVDRNVIKTQRSVSNAQRAISSATNERRERELLDQLRDEHAGPILLAPLASYNEFAASFNCQVYAPDRVSWQQDRPLGAGYTLRIHGLTSTLLSGAGMGASQDDTRDSLYLSPLQTVLDPIDGIVNLVLCHHPPDWFMDHDAVEDAISGRSALQFFGHKHRQRINRDATYVRVAAGAVNPDRNEPGWEPGYNLVKLDVVEERGAHYLDVEAHLLCWQTNPDCFRPRLAEDRRPVFQRRLPLRNPPTRPAIPPGAAAGTSPAPTHVGGAEASGVAPDGEATAMSEPKTRNLVFRFWELASSQRREIAQRFGLITDEDMKLPEPERYGRALLRAHERGLLEQIGTEIERFEKGV
jgi:predicted MPP superfamily phosphohydrolase